MGRPGLVPAVGFLSAATIAYEILLVRLFAVEQFHHFATMVIGVALLGSGASGTLGALRPPRRLQGARRWVEFAAVATAAALVFSPWAAHHISVEPTQLAWEPGQWVRLFFLVLVLALPFLAGGLATLTAFALAPGGTGRLYGASFAGGALGVVLAVAALFLVRPDRALLLPPLLAAVGTLMLVRRGVKAAVVLGAGLVAAGLFLGPLWSPRLTPYKGLPQLEAFPGAHRVAERISPLGWVVAVEAPAFRLAPGLWLGFRSPVPPQTALLVDGDVAGAAMDLRGTGVAQLADALPTALPYALGPLPRVLLLGSGDALGLKAALTHGAERVVTVDPDGPLLRLAHQLSPLEPGEAGRTEDRVGHARAILARSGELFDLISVAPASGHGASVGGVRALDEDFLHTEEAYHLFLSRLSARGILSVTRWLSVPPRESVRTVLTMAAALRRLGPSPSTGLVLARSWGTVTVLARPSGFRPAELATLRAVAAERGLDLDWPPELRASGDSINRFDDPSLKEAAATASSPEAAERFAKRYPFDVAPVDDARPYPHHFLRLAGAITLLRSARGTWLPFAEWGPIAVMATLVQAVVAAAVLLLLPAARWARRSPGGVPLPPVLGFFAALGLAYVAAEVAAIQQLGLLLGHPVYAVAAVLALFLACSGMGSRWSDGLTVGRGWGICLALGALFSVAALALLGLVHWLQPAPGAARLLAAVLCVGPPALLMGMPFPLGLRALAPSGGELAWAWAANGFASVVAAPLSALVALEVGSRALLAVAAAAYFLAGLLLWSAGSTSRGPSPQLGQTSGAS